MGKLFLLFLPLLCTFLLIPTPLRSQSSVSSDSLSTDVDKRRAFDYFFLQSLSLKAKGDYSAAYDMLMYCLHLQPDASEVLSELSTYYDFLGRTKEAIEMMKKAVTAEPYNLSYAQSLAIAYQKNNQIDEAILLLEWMSNYSHSKSDVLMTLAQLYVQQEKYDKAIATLDIIEKYEGSSEQLTMQKYKLYLRMQKTDMALRVIEKLIEENPSEMRYKILLGDALLENGNLDEAYSLYMKVLSQDEDNTFARLSLMNYYQRTQQDSLVYLQIDSLCMNEKLDENIKLQLMQNMIANSQQTGQGEEKVKDLFNRMLSSSMAGTELAVLYVHYLLMMQEGEEVVSPVLHYVLEKEPENFPTQMQLLRYVIERKDYKGIIKLASKAIEYNPEMLQLYYYLGLAYFQTGDTLQSLNTYIRGLENKNSDASDDIISTVFSLLGDTWHELNHRDETYAAYDSALVYNSENIFVLNNYAYFLTLEGKELKRAEEMSRKAIELQPDNAIYVDTYAWVLFRLGRYSEARVYAQKLLDMEEELNAAEYAHCGDIFALCQELDKALECWIKAREAGDNSKILSRKIRKQKYLKK